MPNKNSWILLLKIKSIFTILFIFMCLVSSGCEPLRKKFTRKKKQEQTSDVVPILEPIDYPRLVETSESQYRYHYSLWQIWHRDFLNWLEEKKENDKKAVYILNQMIVQMEEMQKFIQGEKRTIFSQYIQQVKEVLQEFEKPRPVRNYPNIQYKISSIGKQVRKDFKIDQMKDNLTQ